MVDGRRWHWHSAAAAEEPESSHVVCTVVPADRRRLERTAGALLEDDAATLNSALPVTRPADTAKRPASGAGIGLQDQEGRVDPVRAPAHLLRRWFSIRDYAPPPQWCA